MGVLDILFGADTRNYIKTNEGYNPEVYKDTKNINTTGYGFNLNAEHVRKYVPQDVIDGKRGLTQEESNSIFEKVYSNAVKDAETYITPEKFKTLPDNAKKVLIDMSYNIGLTKLNKFKQMKKALMADDYMTAGKELLDSKYAREDVPNRANKNYEILTGLNPVALSNLFNKEK